MKHFSKTHDTFLVFCICLVIMPILSCAGNPTTRNQYISLDTAIQMAADNLNDNLESTNPNNAVDLVASAEQEMLSGQTDFDNIRRRAPDFSGRPVIAVLNISSSSERLSSYVLDELTIALARGNSLNVVDRQRLDIIRQEERFQLSGEVSDESAQAIGKKLGAQYVITGELLEMDGFYRFRVRALAVETARVIAPTVANIDRNDRQIASIVGKTQTVTQQQQKPPAPPRQPREPKPSNEPIEVNPLFNFGLGFGGGENVSFDIELLCFQAGVNLGRFDLLLEAIGGPAISDEGGGFVYHLGGLLEYRFFDKAVLGLGGGYGGQAGYGDDSLDSFSYPYIRGSASVVLGICKLGAFYDYCFDYGSRFGLRGIFEITRAFQ